MANSLSEQISLIPKNFLRHETINLKGLIDCSTKYLSTNGSTPTCLSISLLGRGSFNVVFQLIFDNEVQLAASLSQMSKEIFNAEGKQSEIDTMKFVRESGLYPDVPVPKVHTWDHTFNNPVGVPYVLMDVVPGQTLEYIRDAEDLRGLDALTPPQQLSVVKTLAKLQASLSKPVPFDKIGSIKADAAGGGFSVGPVMTLSLRCLAGPFESIQELWHHLLDSEMLESVEDWCTQEKDEVPVYSAPTCTPQLFAEMFQLISSLIPHFKIPQPYNTLVLRHPDIAIRNVMFDKESLSTDHPKLTGLLDWSGAQILPLMLTAVYPEDLLSSGDYPYTHPTFSRAEDWDSVPFDWTSIGDKKDWPKIMDARGSTDMTWRLAATVRRFYLRAYFNGCYAQHLYSLNGDTDLAHATLFSDAPYYLKFHELLRSGVSSWTKHASWIRETYWRLRTRAGKAPVGEVVIKGLNVYRASVRTALSDMRIPEEIPLPEDNPYLEDCY